MPPPSRAHTTATGSYQVRQNRNARARHSLDNTGFSIDSSELPSGLIVDYSIDDVLRPGNIAELGRSQQTENIHLDDDEEEADGDADVDPEEVDLGKANISSSRPYVCLLSSLVACGFRKVNWERYSFLQNVKAWLAKHTVPFASVKSIAEADSSLSDQESPRLDSQKNRPFLDSHVLSTLPEASICHRSIGFWQKLHSRITNSTRQGAQLRRASQQP